jgi:hypothetical protein
MALEASDGQINIIACLLDIMGKSKEISQDLRKRIVDLHKSGSSLEAIYQLPEGTTFICTNNSTQV